MALDAQLDGLGSTARMPDEKTCNHAHKVRRIQLRKLVEEAHAPLLGGLKNLGLRDRHAIQVDDIPGLLRACAQRIATQERDLSKGESVDLV